MLAIVLSVGLSAPRVLLALPAYILQLPSSVESVLIAETDTSMLHRYTHSRDGVDPGDEHYMSVGERGVGKQRAWDRRTPLGIYFISEQLDTSKLHEKYGPTAFALDYPNIWDRINDRAGSGIWIHGVAAGGGRRPPLATDGCIALPNDALMTLERHLVAWVTPVIITQTIQRSNATEIAARRSELNASLQRWARSFEKGDWYSYLSLYAADFQYHGMNKEEWGAYLLQSAAGRQSQEVVLDDVLLLGDPQEQGLYLSRFRQTIIDADRRVVTTKRLYWRHTADDGFKIVAEDNG